MTPLPATTVSGTTTSRPGAWSKLTVTVVELPSPTVYVGAPKLTDTGTARWTVSV